jgi:hypothetical protein
MKKPISYNKLRKNIVTYLSSNRYNIPLAMEVINNKFKYDKSVIAFADKIADEIWVESLILNTKIRMIK